MRDPLDDALGLPPIPRQEAEIIVPDATSSDEDYEYARRNLYSLIAKGDVMLDELADIARVSEHPRAFEVYANLYRSLVDTNKDLMNLKKTHRELERPLGDSAPRTVNNTLVATSEEILKMLKEKR